MNSNAPISGYRFNDLKRARIVSSRGDLHEKQKKHGFPKPAKFGERAAWWPDDEIRAWVQSRLDLRDNPNSATATRAEPSPPTAEREAQIAAAVAVSEARVSRQPKRRQRKVITNKPSKSREAEIA